MKKLTIPMPVIVEGRYDKIRLSNIIDAEILTTAGFGIFNHREKLDLIRALAAPCGIIVLTDSDGAGTLIRSHISSALPKDKVYHLYIPQIPGKERRKSAPSRAGTLGVEGMDDALLYEMFLPFAKDGTAIVERGGISKADLFAFGLTGTDGSAAARDHLAAALHLPAGMTPNALLGALNVLCSKEEFAALAASVLGEETAF